MVAANSENFSCYLGKLGVLTRKYLQMLTTKSFAPALTVDARVDLGVVAVEVELAGFARMLDPLQVGLRGEQISGAGGAARGCRALRGERAGDLVAHGAQPLGAAGLTVQRPGELLLGELLAAHTRSARKRSRGKRNDVTARVVGRIAENWRG
jgi:hypothetical protein